MLSTIGDDEIDVSPNGTLTMTLAETRAAAQPTAVFNALEEINVLVDILAPEMLYVADAK
jgi:hypothetical protein